MVNGRVLVVDDDPGVRKLAGILFRRVGWETETTADAGAIEDRMHRFQPDLVLLDLHLEGMSGIELAARIHAQSSVKIVCWSSDDSAEADALNAGCDAFVAKPFDIDHLIAVLGGLLPA